jgi:hypothetical protein
MQEVRVTQRPTQDATVSEAGGPAKLSSRETAQLAAVGPAIEALSQKLVDRPDVVAALARATIPLDASGSVSSTSQEDYTSGRPGREDMAPQGGGAEARPRTAQEIRGMLSTLLTEDQGYEKRARGLFGKDAAGPASAPQAPAPVGRMVPKGFGSHSFAPSSARWSSIAPAASAPAPAPAGRSFAMDARPSAMGSQSIGNAAWARSGGRSR